MPFFIGVLFLFLLWFLLLLLFALFLVWLFRVLVSPLLRLRFPAVRFCPFWVGFPLRSVLAVLRALTASCVLPFRPLLCSVLVRLPLAVGFPVLRLLSARLRLFLGALRRAVCLLRFRLVLVLLGCRFLLRSVVVVRVRGVRWRLLLVWVFLCLWCRLWALALLGLVLSLPRSVVWVLLLAVACCGVLFLFRPLAVSFLCFSSAFGGLLDF